MSFINLKALEADDLENGSKESRLTSSTLEDNSDYMLIGEEVLSEKIQWSEDIYQNVLQWFQKKGVKRGKPEQFQEDFNQKKKAQILKDPQIKLFFSSGLLQRRKHTRKNSTSD